MAPLQSLVVRLNVLILAVEAFSQAPNYVKAIVGDEFMFPASCASGESGRLERVLDHGVRPVATCQSGEWMVSREHTERVKINSSKIVFSNTLYTDGGMYELSGSKSATKLVQLDVVLAMKESAAEDEKVIVPCYFETTGKTGLTPLWEKNGERLCVKNANSGECSGTPSDRLSVSADWLTHGDLSLTVNRVQPGDRGDYSCYVQDQRGKQSGTPAAVIRLSVAKKHRQITGTPAPRNRTQIGSDQIWKTSTVVLGVILGVLLVLVALFLLYLCRHGKLGCDSGKLYEVVQSCHSSPPNEAITPV